MRIHKATGSPECLADHAKGRRYFARCATVVVYAGQGAGKTRHAEKLKDYFGCSSIQDEWHGDQVVPAGTLILTNLAPPYSVNYPAIHLDEIKEALK